MKILGIDLGTNSLGWAVVEKENKKILDTGVRIFPEGVVAITIGQGEKEKSKNSTRRDHRQMRRQFYRKRLRKIKLLEILIDQNMCPLSIEDLRKWKNWDKKYKSEGKKFPDKSEFIEWLKLNPYLLRERAIKEKVSDFELGRIFYHLIQRRGFLSSRKGSEETAIFSKGKPEENILSINETKENIREDTLGKYLNTVSYKEGKPYKTITDKSGKEIRVRGRYTTREMYIREFEKIWQVQSQYSDLNKIEVKSSKTRELKGALTGSRNRKKISYLQEKYGVENVKIIVSDKKRISKMTTISVVTLKEFLAGKIETYEEDGESKIQFKSNESVLFWQRPLRSQKGLLSNCRFENNIPVIKENGEFLIDKNGEIQKRSKKPCPISHPDFELLRAYQFVNNISYGKNQKLTREQRQIVLELINKNDKNFDFKKIPEKLKLTYEKFNFGDKQKVAGNPTISALRQLFSKEILESKYEEIWHCFYFYEDNDMLYKKLKKDYGFEKDASLIKKIKLKEGYGSVSLKAIRNILLFLEMGYKYDRAVILGGVKNAFGNRWRFFSSDHDKLIRDIVNIIKEENQVGESIEKIKDYLSLPVNYYGFDKDDPHFHYLYHHSQEIEKSGEIADSISTIENLRNPIVQQGLNEARRLVNTLIEKYKLEFGEDFYFDKIHVEMGRDLRNNKTGRQEMSFQIRENEKKNDDARERLAEYGLQPSRNNIHKYRMFKEIQEHSSGAVICPYTGIVISQAALLGHDNLIQIEHIIPYSISLDDSFGNKTLCEANFNRFKGEKTPYLFYLENPDYRLWGIKKYRDIQDGWTEISERAFSILPYRKAKKFTTTKQDFDKSEFIQRQLNDSRYIAKKAVELFSSVCNDVRVMPGQLTAELRHLWGLNNILQSTQSLNKQNFEVDEDRSLPYYLVSNDNGEVLSIHRKDNSRPQTIVNEILTTGYIKDNVFSSKYFNIEMPTSELSNGKCWAKLNVSEPVQLISKYIDKPETNENSIVFKGKVERDYFKNDTYGRIKANVEDGQYWAKFEIVNLK